MPYNVLILGTCIPYNVFVLIGVRLIFINAFIGIIIILLKINAFHYVPKKEKTKKKLYTGDIS